MIVIRTCGVMVPWSIEPHKESPYFMTSVGHLSGGLFNVFRFGDSKVATDGRMDRRCHKLFATHTHHDCTWHLQHWTFLLFRPGSRQATISTIGVKCHFLCERAALDVTFQKVMFRFSNITIIFLPDRMSVRMTRKKNFIISHCPPLTQ